MGQIRAPRSALLPVAPIVVEIGALGRGSVRPEAKMGECLRKSLRRTPRLSPEGVSTPRRKTPDVKIHV